VSALLVTFFLLPTAYAVLERRTSAARSAVAASTPLEPQRSPLP